jgi:hypothetical protein
MSRVDALGLRDPYVRTTSSMVTPQRVFLQSGIVDDRGFYVEAHHARQPSSISARRPTGGGTITGDRVTMAWDGECPCGRRCPRVKNDVARYSELRDDDKISCAKSPGAYERVANELGALS